MPRFWFALPLFVFCHFLLFAQDPPFPAPVQRDPQSIAILTQSLEKLGGTVPSDSQAVGSFDRVTGSTEDNGNIQILTRGCTQTAEKLIVNGSASQLVYSGGYASQRDQDTKTILPLEESLSSDSVMFPTVLIAAALQDTNTPIQFVANEIVNGSSAYHLQIGRGFTDQSFIGLLQFSLKDVWISTDSGLPVEIGYQKQEAAGSEPRVPVAFFFSDYRGVNGIEYPFQTTKYLNGTFYETVTISSVAFDTGLTNHDFAF